MAIGDLAPWKRRDLAGREGAMFASLHNEIDRLFEDYFNGNRLPSMKARFESMLAPDIDVSETDKEIQVSAELPGVEEKDVDVTLADGRLTIKGEKKQESEEKDKEFHRVERSYGSFERTLSLPDEIDENKVSATFKNGVLSVTIAKKKGAKPAAKKIAVKKG